MGKAMYRLCLVACLLVAISIGVMLYENYVDREEQEQWLLV